MAKKPMLEVADNVQLKREKPESNHESGLHIYMRSTDGHDEGQRAKKVLVAPETRH